MGGQQPMMMPQGYSYPMPMMGGMMMPSQGWGVMPQQRPIKSTTATRKTAQHVRKKSNGKIYRRIFQLKHL